MCECQEQNITSGTTVPDQYFGDFWKNRIYYKTTWHARLDHERKSM